jgi:hypothetical protein
MDGALTQAPEIHDFLPLFSVNCAGLYSYGCRS